MIPTSNPFKEAINQGRQAADRLLAHAGEPLCHRDLRELRVRLGADRRRALPNDIPLMAATCRRSPAMVRRRSPGADWRLDADRRYLDIGAQTILVLMVTPPSRRPTWCARCVTRHHGIRGVGAGSAAHRLGRHPDYVKKANDQVCLLVQAESETAIDNLDAILAVEGGRRSSARPTSPRRWLHRQRGASRSTEIEDGIRRVRARRARRPAS